MEEGRTIGILIGCIAYVDYYFLVYAVTLTALFLLDGVLTVERSHAGWPRWQRAALRFLSRSRLRWVDRGVDSRHRRH